MRHAVRSLSVEVLQWLIGRIYRRELGDVKLSSLDIEILRLEKLGCTARETAEALQESPCRIDRAIRSLNMRMHTTSKKQAAHRAAMAGVLPC
jgi:DNA-binding CsgD family transcriptional regulator